jgi:hypothetical protein
MHKTLDWTWWLSLLTPHMFFNLDVFCFKPFKITCRKKKDEAMVRNNYLDTNKMMLVSWVDYALQ